MLHVQGPRLLRLILVIVSVLSLVGHQRLHKTVHWSHVVSADCVNIVP